MAAKPTYTVSWNSTTKVFAISGANGIDVIDVSAFDATTAGYYNLATSITLIGGNGNDTIKGGAKDEIIWGDSKGGANSDNGIDDIDGGGGADEIHGGNGNDVLKGGDGKDKIYGDNGADVLTGGADADDLTGGAGGDKFVYLLVTDSEATGGAWDPNKGDTILDFTKSQGDKLDLDAIPLTGSGAPDSLQWGSGPQTYGVWVTAGTGGNAGYNFVYADTTGDGVADLGIRVKGAINDADILGDNHAPTVSGQVTSTTNEDAANYSVNLLTGAADSDGDTLHVANVSISGAGATQNGDSVDINPSAYNYLAVGESATINVSYNVVDGHGGSVAQTAKITVNGVNDGPSVSAAVSSTATEDDAAYSVNLLANASDPDTSDVLHVSGAVLSGDTAGATLNGDAVDINPNAYNSLKVGEHATVNVTYNVVDGHGGTVAQTATITINGVNDAPIVSGQVTASTTEDSAPSSVNMLSGASDPDGDTLHVANVTGLQSGVTLNGDSLDVDPSGYNYLAVGEQKVITVNYDVVDGNGGVTAQSAKITIDGVNDGPSVSAAVSSTVTEDAAPYSVNLLANASDPDTSDVLHVSGAVLSGDTAGATLNGDAVDINPNAYNSLKVGEQATVNVTYNVVDGHGGTVAQTATITISGVNDAPTVGAPITSTTNEDASAYSVNLLSGASDPDGDTLHVSGVSITGDTAGATLNGDSVDINPNAYNSLAAGQHATVNVSYNVVDGNGGVTAQTATVTINGVNDAASFTGADTGSVTEDGTLTASGTLTANDPDSGQSSMNAQTGLAGTYGTLDIDSSGNWTYTLNNTAAQPLNTADHPTDTITVHSSDGTAHDIVITVNGADEPPVADPNDHDSEGPTNTNATNSADILIGTSGADSINGQGGNDTIYGEGGNDTLSGSNGDDTIYGGSGDDTINGNNGNDTLYGGSGNDTINGNNDNDVVIGGYGADALNAGGGANVFKYLSALDTGDTITGFVHGTDKIDLTAFGITSAQVTLTASSGNTLVDVNTDGVPGADLHLTLLGTTTVTTADFTF